MINADRLTLLPTLHLDKGAHRSFDDGHCILEVSSWLAGQPHTDHPPCVSPVLRTFVISLNDQWDDGHRQTLLPYAARIVGTAGDGQDEARSYLALDWLIRTYTPAWLDLAGLTVEAAEMRGLRRIVDMVAALAAGPVVRNAQTKSAAAGAAAWAAAGAAAWDALAPTVTTLQTSALTLLDSMLDPAASGEVIAGKDF